MSEQNDKPIGEQVVAAFVEHCKITDGDHVTLKKERALQKKTIEYNIRSGYPEAVVLALDEVRRNYGDEDISTTHLLLQNAQGEYVPHDKYTQGKPLIIYRHQDGTPYFLRPHKDFFENQDSQTFGKHSVKDSSKPLYITEGEFKAMILHELGYQALSIPGVSSVAGKYYEPFVSLLRDLGPTRILISFDNADAASPVLHDGKENPKFKPEVKDRWQPEYWGYFLVRRLECDGFEVGHVRLPDVWRVDGEADIDGVLAHKKATRKELKKLMSKPVGTQEFLKSLPTEAAKLVVERFGDGVLRPVGERGYKYREFPYDLEVRNLDQGKAGIIGNIYLGHNLRKTHNDRKTLATDSARKKYANEAAKKLRLKGDNAETEEYASKIVELIETLQTKIEAHIKQKTITASQARRQRANSTNSVTSLGIDYEYGPGGVFQIPDNEEAETEHVSNFYMKTEIDKELDDGISNERILEIDVWKNAVSRRIQVKGSDFYTNQGLVKALGMAGPDLTFDSIEPVRNVCATVSAPRKTKVEKKFGYQDDGSYLTTSWLIKPDGAIVQNTDRQLGLEDEEYARHLDFQHITDEKEYKELARHVVDDFLTMMEPPVVSVLLGQVGLAPLRIRLKMGNKNYLIIDGKTGDSKSFVCIAAQCFFGDFTGEGACQSWGSTPNSVQKSGYFFNHAVYYVEDFKQQLLGKAYRAAQQVLQSYADSRGRGRLTRTSESMRTYFIRGELLISAEDTPQGEASTLARAITVTVKSRGDLDKGKRVRVRQRKYSAITARYISWVMTQDMEILQSEYDQLVDTFLVGIEGETNDLRIAQNCAQNAMGFRSLMQYFLSADVIDEAEKTRLVELHLAGLMELRDEIVHTVKDEKASNQFLSLLGSMIRNDEARLDGYVVADGLLSTSDRYAPVVGMQKDSRDAHVFIFPKKAYEAIQAAYPNHRLGHSVAAIGKQLKQDGLIRSRDNRLQTQVRYKRGREYCWVLKRSALDLAREVEIEKRLERLEPGAKFVSGHKEFSVSVAECRGLFERLRSLVETDEKKNNSRTFDEDIETRAWRIAQSIDERNIANATLVENEIGQILHKLTDALDSLEMRLERQSKRGMEEVSHAN